MKVILKQTLPKVGKEGTVVNVKPGFARNYLFPQGMAIIADKTQVKALETRQARTAAKLEATKADAEGVASKLNNGRVMISVKSGEQGKLFGAITSQDIAAAIQTQFGVTVDKKQVAMLAPIKRIGVTRVDIDLHRLVDCHMTVVVFDPAHETPVEEAPAAEEAQTEDDSDEV